MSNQLHGFRLYLLLTAISFAAFLVSLDGFIVNVAIPNISGELGVPHDVGTWVITVFSVASTACVPLAGALSIRYGNLPIFIFGILYFGLASVLCGVAYTFSFLLISRVLQGSAAGLISPISLALIMNNFPQEKKTFALGLWSFFVMVGPAMGPMIGGWLSNYHWHWMFYLNIPFTLFSAFIAWFLLRHKKETLESSPIDIAGIVLLFICVGALQSALNRWNIDDWFSSPFIISLFILVSISLIFLIVWEHYHPDPFIHLKLFKKRTFTLPTLTTATVMGLLFSSFTLDSLWVQQALGYTPAWAGLTLTPVGIFPLIFYPIMGRIVNRLDARIWVGSSMLLYAITFVWLSRITVYTSFWQLAVPRLVQGVGFALLTVPNAWLTLKGVPPEKTTSVIALYSFMRMLFTGLGVALGVTLWIFRQTFYQTRLAEKTFASNPHFKELLAPFEMVTQSEPKVLGLSLQTIQSQSSTLALADIYYLYAWLCVALFCVVVLFYKTSKN